MKKILSALAVTASLAAGCSSGGSRNASTQTDNRKVAETAATNSNHTAMTNVEMPNAVPYRGIENLDRNALNAVPENSKVVPVDADKNQLAIGTRPAPDDSVIVTTMNRQGNPVETRTFNRHPLLAKVEKITIGKDPQYKVYLRSGKVLNAPVDKMENFRALAPENILDAVGQLPKPAADANRRSADKIPPSEP